MTDPTDQIQALGVTPSASDAKVSFETTCVKRVPTPARALDGLSNSIFPSSTYQLDNVAHGARLCDKGNLAMVDGDGYVYSRLGSPTNQVVAATITSLEGGYGTFLFASGMSAITTTLLSFLTAGDHIVIPEAVYGGTFEFLNNVLARYGVECTSVKGAGVDGPEAYRQALRPNTKVVYLETPCNPTMRLTDIAEVAAVSTAHGAISVVDSTFASPYHQQPLQLGADVVVHSCTKYFGGHSDILGGSVTCRTQELLEKVGKNQKLLGGSLSPFDAFLLGRGIKTLSVRMARHSTNAMKCAEYLEAHPLIQHVYYPGLPSHTDHALANKQMTRGFGGMISFEVKGGLAPAAAMVENVKLIHLAVSLGGVESLVEHPASMTHNSFTPEQRAAAGIPEGLIRFSVGLEDIDDLIRDLAQALEHAAKAVTA